MIISDPNETFEVPIREHLPEDQRPVFVFFVPTRRETRQARKTFDSIPHITDGDEAWEQIDRVITDQLAGWRNLMFRGSEITYDPDNPDLEGVISEREQMELLAALAYYSTFGLDEAKKSKSPLPSDTVGPDEDAAADEASAKTARPKPSPSQSTAPDAAAEDANAASNAEK